MTAWWNDKSIESDPIDLTPLISVYYNQVIRKKLPESTSIMKTPCARLLCIALICCSTIAYAQTKWWESGKNVVKDILGSQTAAELSVDDIGAGLKEALRVGTDTVVNQLQKKDGFNKDPAIHIPLPKSLNKVQKALDRVGVASMLNDLELKLNRAAEAATPKARQIFVDTISQMTLEDVKGIYNGPEDAATRYLQQKMTPPLKAAMQPVVVNSMAEVGAVKSYDKVMKKYQAIPFVPDVKANLTDHVLNKSLDGIFHYLAIEEAAIRKDPAKRTTKLLKKVFNR